MTTATNEWRTARGRSTLSRPAARLQALGALRGQLLDYGCGRGDDAAALGCDSYDPHFKPEPVYGPYDVVLCSYVLNVIAGEQARRDVLGAICGLLEEDGTAYLSVRTKKSDLRGRTSTGSWQGLITLDLPVMYKCSDYTMYALGKGDENCWMKAETF